ncbi:MAG TPA: MsnO8 family LLM class oxidoreductase [Myxococcaceae bacterium]|nr:MsnO8 family LLM class oxidoreductase [Myxococcaceae bacterium]
MAPVPLLPTGHTSEGFIITTGPQNIRLSIIDLGTVAPGGTEQEALAESLAAAEHAEQLGFHRVWFAEHHLSRSGASHHPELLIAAAAMRTRRIRIGSGAVLMNHYSPFKVAELFAQLEAMAPGRVDLGMGRATSGPIIDAALQQNRDVANRADHGERVLETLAWLYEAFPDGHPFAGKPLIPSLAKPPQTWLLGSSPQGSGLAAGLGIGYTFAGFINPRAASAALRHYRERFEPRGFGLTAPNAILAVNVTVGETREHGEHLVNSARGFYAQLSRMRLGDDVPMVPSAEEGGRMLNPDQAQEPTRIVDGQWPRFVAGGPEDVRQTLLQMLEESGADELMIQNLIAAPADRRRSHELLAEMFGLRPPGP